ncbi:MAG: amidohydrolase family protein [Desulfobacterales bacterium]|jgi:adenine deaminase|nr:amidohydrolase family protein [Desulfobacterales bacterium]
MNQTATAFSRSKDEMQALMQVALGEAPADLAVLDADLVNVYTGEVQPRMSAAVKGRWIARVSADVRELVGPATRVIDARGRTLVPGLIDGHTHLAWIYGAAEFVPFAAAAGATTVITEAMEPYPVGGLAAVLDFLESFRDQPIRILATAPAMASISAAARGIDPGDLSVLLAREEIVGLGESYWQAVLQEPDSFLPALAAAQRAGKLLEGHTAGASEKKLNAYLATGVSSCHEPIDADQVLARLRLGMHVMVREGSIRRDLEAIARIRDTGADLRRLVLASDGASPQDLVQGKYMDFVVRKAVACGFAPIQAIQMATLNVAEHFRLDGVMGGIAPGRLADMVLIPEPADFTPQTVVCNGRVIFAEGRLLAPPRRHAFTPQSLQTVKLPRRLTPSDFAVSAETFSAPARVRVIEMVTDLVTAERQVEVPVSNGGLRADPAIGLCKIAAVDRAHAPGKLFTGFIRGFGLTRGAVACSAAWDTSDIIAVGATDEDMACAVNRIADLQGGAVLCAGGRVLAELALPVFGIASHLPMAELTQRLDALKQELAALGVAFPDPLLSLIALTGAAIPYLRICEEGLVNLKDGRRVALFVTR